MPVIQGFLKEKVQHPRAIYGEGVCECAWVVGGLVVGILQNFHFNKRNYRSIVLVCRVGALCF